MKTTIAIIALVACSTLSHGTVNSNLSLNAALQGAVAVNPSIIAQLVNIANTNVIPDTINGTCGVLAVLVDDVQSLVNNTTGNVLPVVNGLLGGLGLNLSGVTGLVGGIVGGVLSLVDNLVDNLLKTVCPLVGNVADLTVGAATNLVGNVNVVLNAALGVLVNVKTGAVIQLTADELNLLVQLLNQVSITAGSTVQAAIKL